MAELPLIGQGIGLATGIFSGLSNIFGGRKEEKEAERLMAEFDYPELRNVFEGMSLSTMGGDILRDDAAQTSADIIDAGRESGGRFLFGALPRAVDATTRASQAAAADIDQQFVERERLRASDEQRIQGINEKRAEDELAGIGARLNYAKQRKQAGFRDLMNAGFATASMFSGGLGGATGGAQGTGGLPGSLPVPENDILTGMPRNYGI